MDFITDAESYHERDIPRTPESDESATFDEETMSSVTMSDNRNQRWRNSDAVLPTWLPEDGHHNECEIHNIASTGKNLQSLWYRNIADFTKDEHKSLIEFWDGQGRWSCLFKSSVDVPHSPREGMVGQSRISKVIDFAMTKGEIMVRVIALAVVDWPELERHPRFRDLALAILL